MASLIANLNLVANILMSLLTIAPVSLLQVMTFFLAWTGCWLPIAVGCAISLNWRPPKPVTAEQKLPLLASLYLIAPLVLWQASRILGRSFLDYGLTWNFGLISSLGIGFAMAVFSLIALFAIQTSVGWITWQQKDWQKVVVVMLLTLLLALWIAGTEELIFRGFVLTQLQQDFAAGWAAVISSLIFAFLHLVWEQRETLPQLPGLWLMGMVLVLARWVDGGSLGLAWGLHAGWVWAIACLDSLEAIAYTGGREWVRGKHGKPLAGVAGILFLLMVGGSLWFLGVF